MLNLTLFRKYACNQLCFYNINVAVICYNYMVCVINYTLKHCHSVERNSRDLNQVTPPVADYVIACQFMHVHCCPSLVVQRLIQDCCNIQDGVLPAVNYYHKALHLGCCSSPRSASDRSHGKGGLKEKQISALNFCCIYNPEKAELVASIRFVESEMLSLQYLKRYIYIKCFD